MRRLAGWEGAVVMGFPKGRGWVEGDVELAGAHPFEKHIATRKVQTIRLRMSRWGSASV